LQQVVLQGTGRCDRNIIVEDIPADGMSYLR